MICPGKVYRPDYDVSHTPMFHQMDIADMVFEEVKEADTEMIVLPGGLPGATNLDAHKGLSDSAGCRRGWSESAGSRAQAEMLVGGEESGLTRAR